MKWIKHFLCILWLSQNTSYAPKLCTELAVVVCVSSILTPCNYRYQQLQNQWYSLLENCIYNSANKTVGSLSGINLMVQFSWAWDHCICSSFFLYPPIIMNMHEPIILETALHGKTHNCFVSYIHSKSQYMYCASNQWWSDCGWGHCHCGVCQHRTYYYLSVQCWWPEFLCMWACAGHLHFAVGVLWRLLVDNSIAKCSKQLNMQPCNSSHLLWQPIP